MVWFNEKIIYLSRKNLLVCTIDLFKRIKIDKLFFLIRYIKKYTKSNKVFPRVSGNSLNQRECSSVVIYFYLKYVSIFFQTWSYIRTRHLCSNKK